METIERFLSDSNLERLASKPTYERGCEYSQHLHVVRLRYRKTEIDATVEGREDYEVCLRDEGAQLGFSCTCPVGQQKTFCKHAVATALTWKRERRSFERDRPPRRTVIRIADVRSHLMTLEKAELVERLLTLAAPSPERLDEMKLDTAWRGPGGPDIPALKHAVRTWMWGSNNGQQMGIWPQAVPRVELILSIIRSLVRDGRYDDAITLLDNVFRTAPVCSWLTFDYDGEGGHKDLLNTFQELHYDACRRGRVPVEKLAHDLLDYEIELDVALFANALRRYSPLLGKTGIRHYIRALEELARAAKPLKPAAV